MIIVLAGDHYVCCISSTIYVLPHNCHLLSAIGDQGHAVRLNSRTGIEGLPVSSVNCDRSLHSGLKAPELVMDAGCRDNRWTPFLCT